MKNLLSIFIGFLFLTPVVALAGTGSVVFDASSGGITDDVTLTETLSGRSVIMYRSDGCSVPACNDANYNNPGFPSSFATAFGALPYAFNGNQTGVIIAATIDPMWGGFTVSDCYTLADCISNGHVVAQSTYTINAPPAASPGLGEIIDNATSSVDSVTGFGMNSMATWGWVNIGKPALGMGLGTLYTLRWYIFSLIGIAIIIFFAFRYRTFFKS